MPVINFKMSDNQKFNALWSLVNPGFNEEGQWTIECEIVDVYDDYAIVKNFVEDTFERVYYVKDEETDSITISARKRCYMVDLDEEEKDVIDYLRKKGCHTNEEVVAHFEKIESLESEISEKDTKVEELNTTIATLTMERDQLQSSEASLKESLEAKSTEFAKIQETVEQLTAEKEQLIAYKKNVEDEAKRAVISQYVDSLPESIINEFTVNLDKYTAEELDMKLTYEVKKANPNIFSHNPQPAYVPKEAHQLSGLESILARYEKQ